MNRITKILDQTIKVCDIIASLFLMATFLVMIAQVVVRYIFGFSFPWAEELSRFLIIYAVFFITVGIYRRGEHPKVEIIYDKLPPKGRYILNYFFYALMAGFFGFMVVYGYRLCASTIKPLTAATRIPKAIPFAAVGLGSLLSLFQTIAMCRENYLNYHKPKGEAM